MSSQLVAFSGFSATNYIQESYSADLDFGTGEFSVGAWVTLNPRYNLLIKTEQFDDGVWGADEASKAINVATAPDGTLTADGLIESVSAIRHTFRTTASINAGVQYNSSFYVKAGARSHCQIRSYPGSGADIVSVFNLTSGVVVSGPGAILPVTNAAGWFRVSQSYTATANYNGGYAIQIGPHNGTTDAYAGDGLAVGLYLWGGQLEQGSAATAYQRVNTASDYGIEGVIAERGAASGPNTKLFQNSGFIKATAFDGTTTRTVTTPSAYNTGIFTKATANYTAAGKLSINVNGVEVAAVTGAPLTSLNNSGAVLTIGNSRTLDAPFPGSITMLKLGATVPTPEQALWMYEQEKQMFRAGAQVTLPEATPVLDLGYDESQDKWVAVQSGHESSFTGLIRTATATPSVGNFTKVVAGSGVKALARDAGVDIQIPAFGLREELVKRAEAAAKASKTLTVFDFDAIAAQTDFVLPAGWKTASVVSAGNTQREGATKNFIRLFDGFRETIRFAVAPGAAVWIRINAIKE